jgi:alkanesulfonate monooxygenase SsuD/methylene tetrahydromethanopterin reductase-like flavin-dependent oxidoreductase (luciferase family)
MAGPSQRSIGSAVGRMLAVFDTTAEAEAAVDALTAAGIEPAKIERFQGADDAAAFDASGRRRGLRGRLYRIIEFSWADQAPDFAWYEAAVREGRVVLSVRVRGQRQLRQAADIVLAHGGHFVNHFGWFETQELARWRGKEPDLPGFLRR